MGGRDGNLVAAGLRSIRWPFPRSLNSERPMRNLLVSLSLIPTVITLQIVSVVAVAAQVHLRTNPKDGLTYVWIPAGTFQMGCSRDDSECDADGGADRPLHVVTLTNGFWIGQTPVTQAAYSKVTRRNPSHFRADQLPVEMVSWDDANAYCKNVGTRLPTEAEWEYAARGGNPSWRYGPLERVAWYTGNSGGSTHKVGQKQANRYGLYDMLGNVWEWVADWYGPYPAGRVIDPHGPAEGQLRVIRNSSWYSYASTVRVSNRGRHTPGAHEFNVGFRCAGD